MFDRLIKKIDDPAASEGDTHTPSSTAITGSVLQLVPVRRMYDNMALLEDGTFIMVIEAGSVNMDLKTEDEQVILLNTFGEVLSALSIDFPLQILLHAAHMDTRQYTNEYARHLQDPNLSPQMRAIIEDHIEHYETTARDNYLLDRSAYLVIPHFGGSSISRAADGGIGGDMPAGGFVKALFDRQGQQADEPSRAEIDRARIDLERKCALMINGLARLPVAAEVLSEWRFVSLLREMYNPGVSRRQATYDVADQSDLITVSVRSAADRTRNLPQIGPGSS
jgi:hypothetical protein